MPDADFRYVGSAQKHDMPRRQFELSVSYEGYAPDSFCTLVLVAEWLVRAAADQGVDPLTVVAEIQRREAGGMQA